VAEESNPGNGTATELRLPIAALKADPVNPRRMPDDAMELEPRYVHVAVARWEKFTGKKAIRADAQPEAANG